MHNQDLNKPFATLLTAIDISKGFNLIEHNELITLISDPGWLTKILVSYLTGRTLQIRWKSKISRKMPLNSGAGQGSILVIFCICIIFNGAGPKASKENIGQAETQPRKKKKTNRDRKKEVG